MDHGECWNLAFPPALLGCWRFLLREARGELLIFVSGFSWSLEAETEPRSTKVRERRGGGGKLMVHLSRVPKGSSWTSASTLPLPLYAENEAVGLYPLAAPHCDCPCYLRWKLN